MSRWLRRANKWNLADLHNAMLKAAGYKVEGSTVRTASGALKVTATLEASLRAFLVGGKASGTAEGQGELTKQTSSTPLQLDPGDVNDIISALIAAEAPKFIVLEDYHYLPEETQKDFAVALKAFRENSSYCFVVIGVWLDENRLTQYDLPHGKGSSPSVTLAGAPRMTRCQYNSARRRFSRALTMSRSCSEVPMCSETASNCASSASSDAAT